MLTRAAFRTRNPSRRRRPGAPPVSGGPTASSVSERGVTLTFWDAASGGNARQLPVRQYHDGSWAITHDGGPVFVDVFSPAYQLITGLPISAEYPDGTRAINGLMVNPGAAYTSGSRGANGLGTPGDLAANDIGTPQGYDSRVASITSVAYSAALNYHPGRTGARLRYDPGQEATLAVAISIPSPSSQTNLQEVVYVTICNTLPPVGSLRPAPAAISKASPGLVADLNLSVLPNDARPSFTQSGFTIDPTVANAIAMTARPNLMIQYTTGNNAEVMAPTGHHPPYGRDIARRYNMALSILNENTATADKRVIAGNIAQIAIDHFDRIAQGGVFYANGQRTNTTAGGHDQWRLFLCCIAARMMQSFPRYSEFAGYCGNMFLWPEPDQIGRISAVHTYDTTGGVHPSDDPTSEPGGNARKQARNWHIGMPEFIQDGNVRWGSAYRGLNNAMMMIGMVNLYRVSGAAALIPTPTLQLMVDYGVTRAMDYWTAGIIVADSTLNTTNGQWDYDVQTFNARWTPQQTGTVTRTAANFETAYGDNRVWATFDKMLSVQAFPATSAFTVTVNGSPRNVTGVDVMGFRCCVTIDGAALVDADNVRISYAVPGTNFLRTTANVAVAVGAFSNVQALPVPLNTPSASFDRVRSNNGGYVEQLAMPALPLRKFAWAIEFAELAGATSGQIVGRTNSTNTRIWRASSTQIWVQLSGSSICNIRLTISPSTSLRRLMITVDGTVPGAGGVVAYLDDTLLTPAAITHVGFTLNLTDATVWPNMRFFADNAGVVWGGSLRYAWFFVGDAAAVLPDLTQQTVRDAFLAANQVGNNGRGPGNVLPQPLVRIGAPLASWNDPLGILSEGAYGPPWTNPVPASNFALAP